MMGLLAIFYQDVKERQVYWWLFVVCLSCFASLHILEVGRTQFLLSSVINSAVIITILGLVWGYVKFKIGMTSLRQAFGLGDFLFLLALAIGFPTVSFSIFFVFGLFFSLLIHGVLSYLLSRKRSLEHLETTVPLAGYLALFFFGVLLVHWSGYYEDLYLL